MQELRKEAVEVLLMASPRTAGRQYKNLEQENKVKSWKKTNENKN